MLIEQGRVKTDGLRFANLYVPGSPIRLDWEPSRRENTLLPIPTWEKGIPIISPPLGSMPGTWIGAPRGAIWEDKIVLATRFRQPEGKGRGGAIVLFESPDGIAFDKTPIQVLTKEQIYDPRYDRKEPASMELASLVRTPDGRYRLYISLGEGEAGRIKQWHTRMMEASAPNEFDPRKQIRIIDGNDKRAVKDPAVKVVNGMWYLAAACHRNPISDPQNADRMYAGFSTSKDGIVWTEPENVFEGVPGTKYARGFRITEFAVNPLTHQIEEAYGDGRPDAAHNWFELTFRLVRDERTGRLVAASPEPILKSPERAYTPDGELLPHIANGAARYLSVVPWPEKEMEFVYYEATGPGGINSVHVEPFTLAA